MTYEVLDTAGNDPFMTMTKMNMTNSDAIVILYSIVNRESFANVCEIIELFQKVKSPQHPIILVGHKLDLEAKRVVCYQEGLEIAKKYGVAFIEASAKSDINIETIFKCTAEMCMIQSDKVFPKVTPTNRSKKRLIIVVIIFSKTY